MPQVMEVIWYIKCEIENEKENKFIIATSTTKSLRFHTMQTTFKFPKVSIEQTADT